MRAPELHSHQLVVLRCELSQVEAGRLSLPFDEGEQSLGGEVEIRPFDPDEAKDTAYPITTYQPLLWSVGSIQEAFDTMNAFVTSQGL